MVHAGVHPAPKAALRLLAAALVVLCSPGTPFAAEDVTLSTAGAGYAPMDVSKAQDPMVPMSKSQREELLQQFKGLVAMGIDSRSYGAWSGRSMADCESPSKGSQPWCEKCQIDMPDASGQYFFYPNSHGACTLQQVDIHVKTDQEAALKDFRAPLQEMLGRGTGNGTAGRHWDTGEDVADLYVDRSASGEAPTVRFLWNKPPLSYANHRTLARRDTVSGDIR